MAVPVPALRLRPLTLMDVLDESFRLYRANFPLLAGLSVGLAIPVLAVNLISIGSSGAGDFFGALFSGGVPPAATPSGAYPYVSILQYPVQLAMVPFQAGTLFAAAVAIVLGNPVGFSSALRSVVRRYWAIWAVSVLYLVSGFALVCLPLGAWLLTRLALTLPVLFTEQASVGTAIDRSWRLTDRAFWRTFVIVACTILLGYALQTALAGVFITAAGLFPGLPIVARLLLVVATASLMTQLVEPLFALAVTLVYFDLRVRREAFDLEILAYQVSAAAGERP